LDHNDRSRVITGSSSGIGRASALLLAQRGFQVFAGVRRPADGAALRSDGGEAIVPVILDVTEADSIAAAADDVTRRLGGRPRHGLVNVAGFGLPTAVGE
jgi:NAD(P)-dependent dehydrogenase (short-subunit alcohol dehydrogenase family)